MIDRGGDLVDHVEDDGSWKPSALETSFERLTLKELHGEPRVPMVDPEITHGDDVGVRESLGHPSFSAKALECLDVLRDLGKQHLDCGGLASVSIVAAEYLARRPVGEGLVDDPTSGEDGARFDQQDRERCSDGATL